MAEDRKPKKVKIGYATWRIHWLTPKQWKKDKRLSEDLAGQTNAASHDLFICTEHPTGVCDKAMLQETLLHELLHATLESTSLNQTMLKLSSDDLEEGVVAGLAGPLLAVFLDNPKATTWIFEKS